MRNMPERIRNVNPALMQGSAGGLYPFSSLLLEPWGWVLSH